MLSEEKKRAIGAAAQQWAGTPFRKRAEIRGVGADCVHLARGIMVSAGFRVPEITIRNYPLDWAKHQDRSLVTQWIDQCGVFVKQSTGPEPQTGFALQPGDVLCIKQGRCSHHIALMIDERQFIHVQCGRSAELGIIDDPTFTGMLDSIYRHVDAL